MAKKTALILDFGGVISRTLFETHDESERVLGLAPGTLDWRGPFDPDNDPLWRAMQRRELTERGYWRKRVSQIGALSRRSFPDVQAFVRTVRGVDPNYAMRPEALAAIPRLKARGVRMAVLTNEMDKFYGYALRQRIEILKQMEVIVDATYTDVLKPDPRAYQMVLGALMVRAADALFVDDQPHQAAGARAVGIEAVDFDVTKPAESWAKVESYF